MKKSLQWMAAAAALSVAFAASCRTAAGEPMPGPVDPPSAVPAPPPAPADTGHHRHTEADVRFMQGMIGHHAQALEMTALVPERAARPELRILAERIAVSQHDEIALMQAWLRARGLEAPAVDSAHAGHGDHALMPGMLTREEMARLAAATGAEFDRLFLEGMIRHHEGALVMVEELFATSGAAQETETYQFAADVDADQRAEIERMRRLLSAPPGARPR